MSEKKYAIILGNLGNTCDRFCSGGYKENVGTWEMLEAEETIEGVSGVELVGTWDIEQMVKEMQSAVSAGVMGMEKFSEEVRRGVDDVRQVGAQLAHIIEQVDALIPRFEEVNETVSIQSQGGQQIRDAIVQLSESAQQTAESLRQSNGAIMQLNEAALRLQDGASHFQVNA